MNSLARENADLRQELDELRRTARLNHDAARRAAAREHRVLGAEGLQALLLELGVHIPRHFRVSVGQLVLVDADHELRHLLAATSNESPSACAVRFVDAVEELPPALRALSAPFLGPYRASDAALFPREARVGGLGSVALLPLRRRDRLLGALCLADASRERFNASLATDHLCNLGIVAAISLESALNRDRLLVGATTDPLTGLRNRRYLDTRIEEALAQAKRGATPLACLLLDLDYFKRVNDTYGHLAGDDVLREIARRIQDAVRASDVCARYGGEELAVLLPDTRRSEAQALAERLRRVVCAAPIPVAPGRAITVTASVGVACIGVEEAAHHSPEADDSSRPRELLMAADRALFRAKAEGRDRVCNAA
ncbi:MAG: GGDEF domain-containing protein [Pseudomonadota bacterium]